MKNDVIINIYQEQYYTYGVAFLGSYKGMRYRIARDPLTNIHENPEECDDPNAVYLVETWEDMRGCYEKCDSAYKDKKTFPFNNPKSISEILRWLNHQYHVKYENLKRGEW